MARCSDNTALARPIYQERRESRAELGSVHHLKSPGLAERIERTLSWHHLDPAALGFEMTETAPIECYASAMDVLSSIRGLGCRVGLDDFGTGYSSLSYLRRLPLDFLKIDGPLIADVESDRKARAIISAIVTMSDALELDTIAEGVESESEAAALRDLGCKYAQGFYFGRPTEVRLD